MVFISHGLLAYYFRNKNQTIISREKESNFWLIFLFCDMKTTRNKLPIKVDNQLKQLDIELIELLKILKDYSEKTLNKKPGQNKWSVIQVMNHLILVEGYGKSYVEKKLSFNPKLQKAGIGGTWRKFIMSTIVKFPFKIKAPDLVTGDNLPVESGFWETAKKWKQQREELRTFLEAIPQDHFNKELYKHPLAGKMSLYGLMDFNVAHFKRHKKQINKILEKSFKIN